ncbi:MAG TPA: sodium:calcium antiporter [Chloroflexota bacterium]|jgi:cation:H+ antiporter|nr:sodium:calcium antiporter [Chloroflexota bacterium]
MQAVLGIIGGILVIFAACELFVNSIEWLGRKLHISENAVGTVLAAIGTALPESLVTLIALVFSAGTATSQDIGIGAIVGGPLMLGTVAYCVVGATALGARKRRQLGSELRFDQRGASRDVLWFLGIFIVAIAFSLVHVHWIKVLVAFGLIAAYFAYAFGELGEAVGEQRALSPLHFHRSVSVPDTWRVALQVALGVAGMIYGAHLFVDNLSGVAGSIGLSAIVLSILLSPVATELPEVMNAILWVRQGKEDLAIGNVSGSMLVQSAVPCALGLAFSNWELSLEPLLAVAAILLGALFVFVNMRTGKLTAGRLLLNGVPYLALLALFIAGL